MGTTKKIKVYKRPPNKKVKIITTRPRHWTDAQWARFNSDEELFPEKVAMAKEMYAKTKFMDEKTKIKDK
jgi:hypothetical protein